MSRSDRSSEPRLGRREDRQSALAPDAARRDLDERQEVANGVAERRRVAVRPAFLEQLADGAVGPGLLVEQLPTRRHDLVDVEAFELAPERAPGREASLLHDLEHRSQRKPVAGREQVDRRPHHRVGAHGPAIQEQLGQLFGAEAFEPRPERRVRIERFLRLERDEVLDRVLGGISARRSRSWRSSSARFRERRLSTGPAETFPVVVVMPDPIVRT